MWNGESVGCSKIVALATPQNSSVCSLCRDIDEVRVFSPVDLLALETHLKIDTSYPYMFPDPRYSASIRGCFFESDNNIDLFYLYRLPVTKAARDFITDYEYIPSDSLSKRVTDYLSEHKINLDKAVVICPYAKSTMELEDDFWSDVINTLRKYGYDIYTNVGPQEKVLEGTIRFDAPVDIACMLGRMGLKYVSVQSGIMDVFENIGWGIKIFKIIPIGSDEERLMCHLNDIELDAEKTYIENENVAKLILYRKEERVSVILGKRFHIENENEVISYIRQWTGTF